MLVAHGLEGLPVRIELLDLAISRGSFSLRGSGTLDEGEHLDSGPVGSGKSMLALRIAGLLRPWSGDVRRHGDLTK